MCTTMKFNNGCLKIYTEHLVPSSILKILTKKWVTGLFVNELEDNLYIKGTRLLLEIYQRCNATICQLT